MKEKLFYGVCLTEEDVDERLGILDELLEEYSEEEALDLYEGALENCTLILDPSYFYYDNKEGLFYFGQFITEEKITEDQKKMIAANISALDLTGLELEEITIVEQ